MPLRRHINEQCVDAKTEGNKASETAHYIETLTLAGMKRRAEARSVVISIMMYIECFITSEALSY